MVKALKPLNLKQDSGLVTGLLTHNPHSATISTKPKVSTIRWRLRPLIRLPPSNPIAKATGVAVLTDRRESMLVALGSVGETYGYLKC